MILGIYEKILEKVLKFVKKKEGHYLQQHPRTECGQFD